MAKQIIRLTESDLHRIIKESVKKILKEDWRDELTSLYDAGKKEGSTGVDMDKVSDVLKNLKKQYGDNVEGYRQAVDKFFTERDRKSEFEKAKNDPAFELWSDEFETRYNNEGYPLAKDFKPFRFDRNKYEKRVRDGELPKALKRANPKNGLNDYNDSETEFGSNNPYKGKSPEEIENIMRNGGFAK